MNLPLTLTMDETILLTDRVQNADSDEGRPIAKPFLLKLASAYLELVSDSVTSSTATIYVTEPEAWLARSKFNSGDRCDRDSKIGVHMLRKLYLILLAFDSMEAAGTHPDAEGDRTFKDARQEAEWYPPEWGTAGGVK